MTWGHYNGEEGSGASFKRPIIVDYKDELAELAGQRGPWVALMGTK